jgi:hypothetical protein
MAQLQEAVHCTADSYIFAVMKQPLFFKLLSMIQNGIKLLIEEVDGPHSESLPYYKERYGVGDDFIVNNTMLATERNLAIMLYDTKHPFGHGYCLAWALLYCLGILR